MTCEEENAKLKKKLAIATSALEKFCYGSWEYYETTSFARETLDAIRRVRK